MRQLTTSLYRRGNKHVQRGMSLVELLVGITVGLFVVAAASTLMAAQLVDNRKLLSETQLQQDLRASLDIIMRQLRRAGSQKTADAEAALAVDGGSGGVYNALGEVSPTTNGAASSQVEFAFFRNSEEQGPFKFKLESGVIKTWVGGSWQELTDASTVRITDFSITPRNVVSEVMPCPKLCPADASHAGPHTDCWPKLVVREFQITLAAQSRADQNVRRSLAGQVRLRNDRVQFSNSGSAICPA